MGGLSKYLTKKHLYLFFLLIILAVSVRQKIFLLQENAGNPLDPDAVYYRQIADQMSSPLDTRVREPLFIWFVKGMFLVFGSSDLNLRILTLALSIGCIVLLFFIARSLFNGFVAVFATFLYGTNYWLNLLSVRGLRHELFTIFVLVFVWFLFRATRSSVRQSDGSSANRLTDQPTNRPTSKAILLGFIAGVGLLANLGFYSFIFPVIIYFGIRRRWHFTRIILPIFLSVVVASPFLIHNRVVYGDFFYSMNTLARGFGNMEFAGKPGFPTQEEVEKDLFCGPELTMFDYIFRLHSPGEVVQRSIRGFWRIYVGEFTKRIFLSSTPVLRLFYLLGIVWLVWLRRFDFLVVFLLVGAPFSFFAGGAFDWRLVSHIAPFTACITMVGVWKSVEFFVGRLNGQEPNKTER